MRKCSWHIGLSLIVLWIGLTAVPGYCPEPIYAYFDGIEGECKDKDHQKWIDVISADTSKQTTGETATRGSGQGDDRMVYEMTMTIVADKSSPVLQSRMREGKVFDTVKIHSLERGTSTYTLLKGVTIKSITPMSDVKTGAKTEKITLLAKEMIQK